MVMASIAKEMMLPMPPGGIGSDAIAPDVKARTWV